jgi:hypothetical protein
MILAAITLPVIVATAALGIGAAMVRSADSEVTRTAELGALAAAANTPVLGRPTAIGVPSVPSGYTTPLPPDVDNPASASFYTTGSIYKTNYNASSSIDQSIGASAGVAPLYQPNILSTTSTWPEGCKVAEAQFVAGRAHFARIYSAESNAGSPVTPHCQSNGSFNDGTAVGGEHIYMRPEMESTGAYRLIRCFAAPTDCGSQLGLSQSAVIQTIGQNFVSAINSALGTAGTSSACLVDPTGTGCPFNAVTGTPLFGSTAATAVQTAARSAMTSVTGIAYSNLSLVKSQLQSIDALLLGRTVADTACTTALGISGENLCGFGVNSASVLPSTLTPRVRTIVHHAVDFPFVPNWTSARVGDFEFTEQALARRSYKNAVVVPTLPANFGVTATTDLSACLRGKSLVASAAAGLAGTTLAGFVTNLTALVVANGLPAGSSTCANADVDGAASGSFTLDLNPALAAGQKDLIAAANALDNKMNTAANTVIANANGRNVSECNQSPPAAWCVDVGGVMIRDAQDIYDPPSGGTAPTASDVIERAYNNGEPVQIMSLGKYVTVPLGTTITSAAGPISAVTYWIPAFDAVPATVTSWDRNHPENTRFTVADPTAVHGLYKAVLLDPTADLYPLCTESPSANGYCNDQPPA